MGRIHLVATPIGNLEDVTLRALRVLGEVDWVLAEDTRRTRVLLEKHGVRAQMKSLHAHNEASRVESVLEALERGEEVALVSDAGTPLLSDPGQRLVAAAVEAGYEVVSVPGASAPLAALSVAGLSADAFTFVGFLPRKVGARQRRIEELRERPETLIFFESPQRVGETLGALAEGLGERAACLARELTKLHEEVIRGTLSELAGLFEAPPRGEITLVVAGAPPPSPPSGPTVDRAIRERLAAGVSARDTASQVAAALGTPRSRVYARVLALRGGDPGL
jgi:16S rRNA (cytidine1402-2'-O)-methyltransferase